MNNKTCFCMRIEDHRYMGLGIYAGDVLLCDASSLEPSRYVVAAWDDAAHICALADGSLLFDEGTKMEAPARAVVYGRVLAVVKPLCPVVETPKLFGGGVW